MQSTQIPEEFKDIRPYADDEVRGAIHSLLHDRHFGRLVKGFVPFIPLSWSRGLLRLASVGVGTTLDFQMRFMKPVVRYILRRYSTGHSFAYEGIKPSKERYTFVSNHRDIVLDSAILDLMLHDAKFPTTVEIAIGDNLLIYPWIRTLVRLNKAFVVQRSLSMREMLRASQTMSRYMHFAVNEKQENIGARRLHTVLEEMLGDIAFNAGGGDAPEVKVVVDAEYVKKQMGIEERQRDLKRYIL